MTPKYSHETVIEYLSKAYAQEAELLAKFEVLKAEKVAKSEYAICYHATRPVPMERIRGRRSLAGIGVQVLKAIKKNMADIQFTITLIENNETETEAEFRELIEEMKL